jgi:hypothetical protein
VKHIIVHQPNPHLNCKDVEEHFNNHELPPISSIKWGFGFVSDKTSIYLWADEAELELPFFCKKTDDMSWDHITSTV